MTQDKLEMINCQKCYFLLFLTINSVTTGARELNGTSQISLATHNAKGEMREIYSYSVFRIRPCGTIFSNVDFSQCRLSASNVKFPQMYLRDLVFDTVNGLLWYVLVSNSAEKATSSGKVLS